MRKSIWITTCVGVLLGVGMRSPSPALAQGVGTTALAIEAGLPLVLGVDLSIRTAPRWRFALGLGRLSGLTSLRAEGRWMFRPEIQRRLVPSLIAGAEQYFLKDGDRDATPVGIHVALGLEYHLDSPLSVGARIGALKTFGSSEEALEVFSVRKGYSTGTFNMGVRYNL